MAPFISVVMPAYNSEAFISESLESVFSQSYGDFEVIVSDDGSRDRTKDIINEIFKRHKDKRARLIENEHKGAANARNKAILASEGAWISFLDSDDIWRTDKLKRVVERIRGNPAYDLWCHSETMRASGKDTALDHYRKFNPDINGFLSLYRENSLSTSAVTVRRDTLLRAGLFDTDGKLAVSEDYDLWLKIASIAKIGYIKDILGTYVIREGNLSSDPMNTFRAHMWIARKHRGELKRLTRFYLFEEMRFRAKVFSATGLLLLSKKKIPAACLFLFTGIALWPFRAGSLKRILPE